MVNGLHFSQYRPNIIPAEMHSGSITLSFNNRKKTRGSTFLPLWPVSQLFFFLFHSSCFHFIFTVWVWIDEEEYILMYNFSMRLQQSNMWRKKRNFFAGGELRSNASALQHAQCDVVGADLVFSRWLIILENSRQSEQQAKVAGHGHSVELREEE